MRAKTLIVAMGCAGLAALTAWSPLAHADIMSFAIGYQSNPSDDHGQCFEWVTTSGSVGLRKPVSCGHYYMPIFWKVPSAMGVSRTIKLRGKVPTSSDELDCAVYVYDNQANLASKSPMQLFQVTGSSYETRDYVVNYVPAGATGIVSCSMRGNARALGISWTP